MQDLTTLPLLAHSDPSPSIVLNEHSDHALLLVCEHAGQLFPSRLGDLGVIQVDRDSHIGWDIGAKQVTEAMAKALGAPAVMQRYSRLVIDCNRPHTAADAMPEASDGIAIPGNLNLSPADRAARVDEIFTPFHNEVARLFEKHKRRMVLSIHSFTPTMNGHSRPWNIGFLFRKDTQTSTHLSQFVHERDPKLIIGMNKPYQIDDISDWFVPHHGEARGIPHSLIEIRNDQLRTLQDQDKWANILVNAVNRYLEEI